MQHEVFEHDLDGAKGLVVHVPGYQVCSLVVAFNSGFQFGDFSHYELPHVMEHILASGRTTNFPSHAGLNIEIRKNGAYLNAHTSSVLNWYDTEFAGFELERIADLHAEYFLEQQFNDEDMATELGNVRQELTRMTTEHPSMVSLNFGSKAYPDKTMLPEQRLEQLNGITSEIARDYFKRTHTWNNMRIYLSGNFPDGGAKITAHLAKQLKRLPAGERKRPDYSPGRSFAAFAVPRDIDQVYYRMAWFSKALPVELWPAAVVLRSLLLEGMGSRIYGAARHQGLAYHVGGYVEFDPGSGEFGFSGYVTRDNAGKLFKLMAEQVVSVRDGNISDEELTAAKNLRSGGQIRSYQTAGQLLNWYMNHYEEREIIEPFEGWIDKLQAVSKAQVLKVIRHVTATDARGATFLGNVTDEDAKKFAAILDPVTIH